MIATYFSVLAAATLLSIWAGTLVIRMIAEWRERRAVGRIRRRWEERREKEGGEASAEVAAIPAAAAAPRVRRGRDVVIMVIAPVLLIAGFVIDYAVISSLRHYDVISRGTHSIALGLIMQVAGAVSFVAAWWWLGRTLRARSCPRCAYDMQMVAGNRCPECGLESTERMLTRKRSRRVLLLLPILLVASSYLTLKWDGVRRNGWLSLVPTTLMIATFEHLPVEFVLEVASGNDAALSERQDDMWTWQKRWLARRIGSTIEFSADPTTMATARELCEDLGGYYSLSETRLIDIMLEWMSSSNSRLRTFGAAMLTRELEYETIKAEERAAFAAAAPALFPDLAPARGRGDPFFYTMAFVCGFSDAHRPGVMSLLLSIVQDPNATPSDIRQAIHAMFQIAEYYPVDIDELVELATTMQPEHVKDVLSRFAYVDLLSERTLLNLALLTAYPDHEVASLAMRTLASTESDTTERIQLLLVTFNRCGRDPDHFTDLYELLWSSDQSVLTPVQRLLLLTLCRDEEMPVQARFDILTALSHLENSIIASIEDLHGTLLRTAQKLCDAEEIDEYEQTMLDELTLELATNLHRFEQGFFEEDAAQSETGEVGEEE